MEDILNSTKGLSGDHVGERIRFRRRQLNLSLRDVAEGIGLSISHVSQVERGLTSPNVRDLIKISQILDVSMVYFFDQEQNTKGEKPRFFFKKPEYKEISFGEGITKLLLPSFSADRLQVYIMRFAPHGRSGDSFFSHSGMEAGIVIQGKLSINVDGQECLLQEEDSFSFPSHLPHKYSNASDGTTCVIWVNVPVTDNGSSD